MINNYVVFKNGIHIPFYIFLKLQSKCNDIDKIINLLKDSNYLIGPFVKPKLLFIITSLFEVTLELYSNPYINILPFVSRCKSDIDFGGVLSIEDHESMIFIDPRPPIELLNNIDHSSNDTNILKLINKYINYIEKNSELIKSLILVTNYQFKYSVSSYDITVEDVNLNVYFYQTKKGNLKYKPTVEKMYAIKSYIEQKKKYYKKYKKHVEYMVIGTKK